MRRAKCVKPTFDPPELVGQVVNLFQDRLEPSQLINRRKMCFSSSLFSQVVDLMLKSVEPDHPVNSMLACKALANLVAAGHPIAVEKVPKIGFIDVSAHSPQTFIELILSPLTTSSFLSNEHLNRWWSCCLLSCQLLQTTWRQLLHLFCQTYRWGCQSINFPSLA